MVIVLDGGGSWLRRRRFRCLQCRRVYLALSRVWCPFCETVTLCCEPPNLMEDHR
jgi:hypothetical protein